MKNRKQIIIPIILLVFFGTSFLLNNELGDSNVRAVDIAQLIVVGMLI